MGAMFAQKQVGWTYVRVRVSLLRPCDERGARRRDRHTKPFLRWPSLEQLSQVSCEPDEKRNRGTQASQLLLELDRSLCGRATVVLRIES